MSIQSTAAPFRILALGDSSTSGIGRGLSCYPTKLHEILQAFRVTEVRNCAVPGATSADVSRYFHTEIGSGFDCLIIYLGNNEGAGGVRRGAYSPIRERIRDWVARRPEKQLSPILSPKAFQFEYDIRSRETAVTPEQFRANMRSTIGRAVKRKASVIVVNPIANRRYPSGVGAQNSSYFAYLDGLGELGHVVANQPVDEPSAGLAMGLDAFEAKDYPEAERLWQPLTSRSDVVGFIAKQNVACANAFLTGFDQAASELQALIGRHPSYDAILFYNLAHLAKRDGDAETFVSLSTCAYEADTSVYRIKAAYRDVISQLRSEPLVHIVDLDQILSPEHFIDYCHPTEEGHQLIAEALAGAIRSNPAFSKTAGSVPADNGSRYMLSLPSPNALRDPKGTLLDYYCIDWSISSEEISGLVRAHLQGQSEKSDGASNSDNVLKRAIANFFNVNERHPIFGAHLDLQGAFLPRSHEILSFPEYFLYRVLYNYMRVFEERLLARQLRCRAALEKAAFSAADYKRIILSNGHEPLDAIPNYSEAYLNAILTRVREEIEIREDIFCVTLGRRLRTAMNWYTREAFRYGTQSRISMLYCRRDIDELIEALVVAVVIASEINSQKRIGDLDRMLTSLLALIRVHEKWCALYHQRSVQFAIEEYEAELRAVESAVKADAI